MTTDKREKIYCEIDLINEKIDKMNSNWINSINPGILFGIFSILCGIACILAALGITEALLVGLLICGVAILVCIYGIIHTSMVIKLLRKKIRLFQQLDEDDLL